MHFASRGHPSATWNLKTDVCHCILFGLNKQCISSTDSWQRCSSDLIQATDNEDVILQCHFVSPVYAKEKTVEWSYDTLAALSCNSSSSPPIFSAFVSQSFSSFLIVLLNQAEMYFSLWHELSTLPMSEQEDWEGNYLCLHLLLPASDNIHWC